MALMRLLSAAVLSLGLAWPAAAACVAPEKLAVLKGEHDFVQTRTLKGIKKPLVSSGKVKPDGDGVLWTVSKPVSIVTRVGPSGITQSIDGGPAEPLGPAASNNPFISETGLLDLLKGDLSKLEARYQQTRETRKKPEGWLLKLKPKAKALAPYISVISVEGCQRVESITVNQANGDAIRIDLKDKPA